MKTLKSSVILAAAISCAFFASCSKVESLVAQAEKYSTITLSIDQPVAENATKTYLGSRSGDISPILWSSGDAICVSGVGVSTDGTYTLKSGVGEKSGTFECTNGTACSGVACAYYPKGKVGGVAVDYFGVTIPSEQKYVENSFDNGAMPMFARANSVEELHSMKPIMSVLKITLHKSGYSVKSICLDSNDSYSFSGTFQVGKSSGALTSGSVNDYVTLKCNPVQEITTAKSFFIVVPPTSGSLNSIKVTITYSDDSFVEKNLTISSHFEAGVIKEVPLLEL